MCNLTTIYRYGHLLIEVYVSFQYSNISFCFDFLSKLQMESSKIRTEEHILNLESQSGLEKSFLYFTDCRGLRTNREFCRSNFHLAERYVNR